MEKDKVVDYLDSSEVLAQLAEECSEAAQAALKMRRALDCVNPTPVTPEEAMSNLIEELADVAHCALVLFGQERDGDDEENIADEVCDTITKIVEQKHERWLKRLAENEEKILSESDEVLVEQDCPHCHNDVVMVWDVEMNGYSVTCPFCGEELRLCNVCQHPYPGRDADDCDRDETTGKCRFSHRCVVEGGQA